MARTIIAPSPLISTMASSPRIFLQSLWIPKLRGDTKRQGVMNDSFQSPVSGSRATHFPIVYKDIKGDYFWRDLAVITQAGFGGMWHAVVFFVSTAWLGTIFCLIWNQLGGNQEKLPWNQPPPKKITTQNLGWKSPTKKNWHIFDLMPKIIHKMQSSLQQGMIDSICTC